MARPKRDQKTSIFVYTEGEVTELLYFEKIREEYELRHVKIEYRGNMKATLKCSIDKKKENQYSEVWCVLDREDEVARNGNSIRHLMAKAREGNVKIAWSNESFENWLLNHFEKSKIVSRETAKRRLLSHIAPLIRSRYPKLGKPYDKILRSRSTQILKSKDVANKLGTFSLFMDKIDDALKNTTTVQNCGYCDPKNAPCSCVSILVGKMLS